MERFYLRRILRYLNHTWDDLDGFNIEDLDKYAYKFYKEKIKRNLIRSFKNSKFFTIKDPRISLLIPIYDQALKELNIKTFYIITKREKHEIAKSLERRNTMFEIDAP